MSYPPCGTVDVPPPGTTDVPPPGYFNIPPPATTDIPRSGTDAIPHPMVIWNSHTPYYYVDVPWPDFDNIPLARGIPMSVPSNISHSTMVDSAPVEKVTVLPLKRKLVPSPSGMNIPPPQVGISSCRPAAVLPVRYSNSLPLGETVVPHMRDHISALGSVSAPPIINYNVPPPIQNGGYLSCNQDAFQFPQTYVYQKYPGTVQTSCDFCSSAVGQNTGIPAWTMPCKISNQEFVNTRPRDFHYQSVGKELKDSSTGFISRTFVRRTGYPSIIFRRKVKRPSVQKPDMGSRISKDPTDKLSSAVSAGCKSREFRKGIHGPLLPEQDGTVKISNTPAERSSRMPSANLHQSKTTYSKRKKHHSKKELNVGSKDTIQESIFEEGPQVTLLEKLRSKNRYNPKWFKFHREGAVYFIVRSNSEEDVHQSLRFGTWCCTDRGNRMLDFAFLRSPGPQYLFFTVSRSEHFCGMAVMVSSVDFHQYKQNRWSREMEVKWIYVKDVPYSHLQTVDIGAVRFVEGLDVCKLPSWFGKEVLKAVHKFRHKTSLFDDDRYYRTDWEPLQILQGHKLQIAHYQINRVIMEKIVEYLSRDPWTPAKTKDIAKSVGYSIDIKATLYFLCRNRILRKVECSQPAWQLSWTREVTRAAPVRSVSRSTPGGCRKHGLSKGSETPALPLPEKIPGTFMKDMVDNLDDLCSTSVSLKEENGKDSSIPIPICITEKQDHPTENVMETSCDEGNVQRMYEDGNYVNPCIEGSQYFIEDENEEEDVPILPNLTPFLLTLTVESEIHFYEEDPWLLDNSEGICCSGCDERRNGIDKHELCSTECNHGDDTCSLSSVEDGCLPSLVPLLLPVESEQELPDQDKESKMDLVDEVTADDSLLSPTAEPDVTETTRQAADVFLNLTEEPGYCSEHTEEAASWKDCAEVIKVLLACPHFTSSVFMISTQLKWNYGKVERVLKMLAFHGMAHLNGPCTWTVNI